MNNLENLEDGYYSAMDDISKIQTAHLTANKMFKAIRINDFEEFKRLYKLDSEKGGLILHRLTAKNKTEETFLEFAEKLNRSEIIEYLKKQTS